MANNPGTDQPRTGIVGDTLKGAALVIVGLAAVAMMDAVSKHLATRWNAPMIAVSRCLGHVLVLASIDGPVHSRRLLQLRRPGLSFNAVLSWPEERLQAALSRTPLAETVLIVYLASAMVTPVAIFSFGNECLLGLVRRAPACWRWGYYIDLRWQQYALSR